MRSDIIKIQKLVGTNHKTKTKIKRLEDKTMLNDWKVWLMLLEMAAWIGGAFYLKARLKRYIYRPVAGN